MSNLIPSPSLDNVPQLERTTVALGGPGAPMNTQAQALLNRSAYILNEISGFSGDISALQASVTSLNTNVSTINGQITTINSEVSTLNSEVATNTTNIATNASNISTNTSGISAIYAGLGVVSGVQQPYTGSVLNTYIKKALDEVSLIDFIGFIGDGVNDDTAAVQAAFTAAASSGKRLNAMGYQIRLTSQVTLPSRLNADFGGSTIIADAAITSGAAIVIGGNSGLTSGQYPGNIYDLRLVRALSSGHADTTSNVDGISFAPASGQASSMNFYGLQVIGFRDNVRMDGPNTYLIQFFGSTIGFCWRRSIAVYANNNSNENYSFFGGSIFNSNNTSFNGTGVYVDPGASATELNFHGVSFDYCDISANFTNAHVNFLNCHFENNNNNPHVVITSIPGQEKPQLGIVGGSMGGGPGITSWTGIPVEGPNGRPYFITTTGGSCNIVLDACKVGSFYTTIPYQTEIVHSTDGIANRRVDLRPILDASSVLGSALPLTPTNTINLTYLAANGASTGWTVSTGSGNSLSASTSIFQSPDTGSRQVVIGSNASTGSLLQTYPCRPGQTICAKTWVQATGMSSGAVVCIRMQFFAQDGSTVIQDTLSPRNVTANTTGFTELSMFQQVPSGAVTCKVQSYMTGTQTVGAQYNFSNEHVWIW